MVDSALADTGALLAFLDRDDRWHADCVKAIATLRLPMLTTDAVLTELFHLVGPRDRDAVWALIHAGGISISPVADEDLSRIEALMEKYEDRPMDFADASLVLLAERHGIEIVFTVDHDDFETYRIRGRKPFRIVPPRRRK